MAGDRLLLLFAILLAVFACCPTLQREEVSGGRSPRQMGNSRPRPMGPGGDDATRTRSRGPMMPKPPPPVDAGFAENCTIQQERSRHTHIRCEEDGSFSPVQCMGPMCFCINTTTGERLNAEKFSMMERDTADCSTESQCPRIECVKNCRNGFLMDRRKCQRCECNMPPPSQRCRSIREVVRESSCSCSCVQEMQVTAEQESTGPRRSRSKAMEPCPSCNETCNATVQSQDLSCAVNSKEECGEGTTLKSIGRHGSAECVQDLEKDDKCVPEEGSSPARRPGPSLTGASKRRNAGKVGSAPPPCRGGLVCREVRYREYACKEEPEGPCVTARAGDPLLECDADGFFKPVQCKIPPPTTAPPTTMAPPTTASTTDQVATDNVATPTDDSTTTTDTPTTVFTTVAPATSDSPFSAKRLRARRSGGDDMRQNQEMLCRCVDLNGTTVEGSEVRIDRRQRAPKCYSVFRECRVPGLDRHGRGHFHVAHGQDYFDAANCRTCECKDGNPTAFCSDSGNCTSVTEERRGANCTLEGGEVIPHEEARMVGCETCRCRNGELRCTKKKRGCRSDDRTPRGSLSLSLDDPCDHCKALPPSPTCGPDGRNHLSHCTATQCAGISPVQLQEGPCQSQDACEEYPCPDGMMCINKRGTVACLGRRGCSARHLRTCVDVDRLSCPVVDEEVEEEATPTPLFTMFDPESSTLCGSDGQTYSSLCHLLQTTSNVGVAYAGPCSNPQCQGGEVCGSDGLTYSNLCELENQAAVRVDYQGPCVANASSTEELCQQVLQEGRCEANCPSTVFPEDGCCPVCGGSIQIVVDIDAITDASDTNPDLQVVDSFTLLLLEAEVLANISNKCSVEVGLTETGHLQIVFNTLTEEFADFCLEISNVLEDYINNGVPTTSSVDVPTTEVQISLPQVYAYAMVASAAEPVQQDPVATTVMATTTGTNGGNENPSPAHLLVWLVVAIASLLLSL